MERVGKVVLIFRGRIELEIAGQETKGDPLGEDVKKEEDGGRGEEDVCSKALPTLLNSLVKRDTIPMLACCSEYGDLVYRNIDRRGAVSK